MVGLQESLFSSFVGKNLFPLLRFSLLDRELSKISLLDLELKQFYSLL